MLVEIPDPEELLALAAAFVAGAVGLLVYSRLRPYVDIRPRRPDAGRLERMEHFERQVIDMKIRLDAMEMGEPGAEEGPAQAPEAPLPAAGAAGAAGEAPRGAPAAPEAGPPPPRREAAPAPAYPSITEHVLRIITDRPMTSRDIQVTIGRTREHTSRLMKKMAEEGLVSRHAGTKPYTYSITEKGAGRLGQAGARAAPAQGHGGAGEAAG